MRQPSWTPDAEAGPAQTIEENWLFRLDRERFRSKRSGKSHAYYVMHLADAVNVIALTPDRMVLFVEQFRAGSGKDSLETPGGLLNSGEDPLVAGARELREETGYAGDPPVLLGTSWSNPSLMSSKISTILIRNARKVAEPTLDEGEEVVVVGRYATLIPRLIAQGEIDHALAVQGLLLWMASELPRSPFLPIGTRPLRDRFRFRFRIRNLMLAIAGLAVLFAILSSLGASIFLSLTLFLALPASAVIVFGFLDPPQGPVLLRSVRKSRQRVILRHLALVGTIFLSTFVILFIITVFRL